MSTVSRIALGVLVVLVALTIQTLIGYVLFVWFNLAGVFGFVVFLYTMMMGIGAILRFRTKE